MYMGLPTKMILIPQTYHAVVQCLEWQCPTQHHHPQGKPIYLLKASNILSSRKASLTSNSSSISILQVPYTNTHTSTCTHAHLLTLLCLSSYRSLSSMRAEPCIIHLYILCAHLVLGAWFTVGVQQHLLNWI